jgi:excisionase family DNA binding protein
MSLDDLLASGKAVITRTEAAELLECDVRTVSRAIDKGEIDILPFGRKKMIPVRPLLKRLGLEG